MKMKLIGTAVTAALLAMSTATFGQAAGGSSSGSDSGVKNPAGNESGALNRGSPTGSANSGTSGATVGTSRDAMEASSTHCDAMMSAEKTRCMRDARASTGGSNMGSTDGKRQVPGDSGNKLGGKDSGGR